MFIMLQGIWEMFNQVLACRQMYKWSRSTTAHLCCMRRQPVVARQEPPPVLCLLTESLILFDSDTVLYKFMFCDMYKYATKSTGLCCMCQCVCWLPVVARQELHKCCAYQLTQYKFMFHTCVKIQYKFMFHKCVGFFVLFFMFHKYVLHYSTRLQLQVYIPYM